MMKNLVWLIGIIVLHLAALALAILVWIMNWNSDYYNNNSYRQATTGVAIGTIGLAGIMAVWTFTLMGTKKFE